MRYLSKYHVHKHGCALPSRSKWKLLRRNTCNQKDAYSCGVHVCLNAMLITDPRVSGQQGQLGIPNWNKVVMDALCVGYRKRLALNILNKGIL